MKSFKKIGSSSGLTAAQSKSVNIEAALANQARQNTESNSVRTYLTKEELANQKEDVKKTLMDSSLCPLNLILSELSYYYDKLGLPPSYFSTLSPQVIANHLLCLYAAKTFSTLSHSSFSIDVRREEPKKALYICNTPVPGEDQDSVPALSHVYEIQRRIEAQYMGEGTEWEKRIFNLARAPIVKKKITKKSSLAALKFSFKKPKEDYTFEEEKKQESQDSNDTFRIQAFRSNSYVSDTFQVHLWFFFVDQATYIAAPVPAQDPVVDAKIGLTSIANDYFIQNADQSTKDLCVRLLEDVAKTLGPKIEIVPVDDTHNKLVICYRSGSSQGYFSSLTQLIKDHGLVVVRKELEPFHGYTIISLHLRAETPQKNWKTFLIDECAFLYTLPQNQFSDLFHHHILSVFEASYCSSALLFIFYFCGTDTPQQETDYSFLEQKLHDRSGVSKLHTMIRAHQLTNWSEGRIRESLLQRPDLVKLLYLHFHILHAPPRARGTSEKTVEEIEADVNKLIGELDDEFDKQVMKSCLRFNKLTIKTNLWRRGKSAYVFDINPDCISDLKRRYPERPYCIFLVVGTNFRGFHVRFSDIARGGVRLIKSSTTAEWGKNAAELFFENYSLALTQQKKNKDIPEGGSKGVILTQPLTKDLKSVFMRYIDAILDMLIRDPEVTQHTKNDPKTNGREDIVFIGPDENTADLMDWASNYAKRRGFSIWKAFTTGKSSTLGGIPHDVFGMTTRGVHQYVLGALEKMGLKEEEMTKCQTGGPDGDLGSNEILISKDKTISIVDGSGVVYDKNGLNRAELVRLATARLTVSNFKTTLLSASGFLVTMEAKNQKLFDGTIVEDGKDFRNNFHLHPLFTADFFVPCGGRPEAVNMSNIDQFTHVTKDGARKQRFKLIVEGANLFISEDARLILEREGVVLFKDACANKGGVTSSSCEVLAALALNDNEFSTHMSAKDPQHPPAFYEKYAKQVQEKIELNAKREFECLWNEHKQTKIPISTLGNKLSSKINELATSIRSSTLLWDEKEIRNAVLKRAIPPLLIETITLDTLLERVPEAYCRWIFSAQLASDYVYSHGLRTTEFTFMTFVEQFRTQK